MKSLTQTRRLVILRDDHIGDPVGGIFLDNSPNREEMVFGVLRSYVGRRMRILKVELMRDRIELQVVVHVLHEEATRLAAAAQDLKNKGAPRNALALFRHALELDPLNAIASAGAGTVLADCGDYPGALVMMKRAREVGRSDADLFYGLGYASLKLERIAGAIVYFERAIELNPNHFGARRALSELGRKPKPSFRASLSLRTVVPMSGRLESSMHS